MIKRLTIISIVSILGYISLKAQSVELSNYYLYDKYVINPASAGDLSYQPIVISLRKQWAGINDSPLSQTIFSHKKFSNNVNIGIKLFNDSYGVLNKTGGELTYAYNLSINPKNNTYVSFGLSAIVFQKGINYSKLMVERSEDPLINESNKSIISPDFGLGAVYHTRTFEGGISLPRSFLFKSDINGEGLMDFREDREFLFHGSMKFDYDKKSVLIPTGLVRVQSNGLTQLDLSLLYQYNNMIHAAITYRTTDSFSVMGGVDTKYITVFYSFNMGLNQLSSNSLGSHELMLAYKFDSGNSKSSGSRKSFGRRR